MMSSYGRDVSMITLKTEREIEAIRKACEIVSATFVLLKDLIQPGISTYEIDREVERYIRSQGGEPAFKGYQNFPASTCISIDSEVVHGIPKKNRKLKEGQIVGIDIGVKKDGFFGDSAATFVVGEVDEEKKRLMDVTRESLYKGIENARVGKRLFDISHAVQHHVENAGFSIVRELVGHGIGRALHEDPQVPNYGKPNSGPRLKPGMVICIEPMVNAGTHRVVTLKDNWTVETKDRRPSAHFEHTVAVTEGDPLVLTQSDLF